MIYIKVKQHKYSNLIYNIIVRYLSSICSIATNCGSGEEQEEARLRQSISEMMSRSEAMDSAIHEAIHYSQKNIEELPLVRRL